MSSKHGVPWSGRGLLLLVTVFIVSAWLASLLLVPIAASKYYGIADCQKQLVPKKNEIDRSANIECVSSRMSAYGTFGDSFGAINALFSGLALAGVVLTLFLHSEAARRTAKPFVVPRMFRHDGNAHVSIREPARAGAIVRLPLHVLVPVHNSSQHPALNIDLKLKIDAVADIGSYVVEVPLAANDAADCALKLDIVGDEAVAFGQRISGVGVTITLRAEYDSVEGVRWHSEAKYLIKTNPNRVDDDALLQHAINGRMADANIWTAETVVDLEFSTVKGSWKYGEVS